MEKSFDPDAFVRRIGERLVNEIEDAKAGTTPGTVGAAIEKPVRDQLQQILPRGVGVGEGFVIDSYGGTSLQQDIIIYERDICPVFSINDTPETTFYPCEGVIAVGEIKSRLEKSSLCDAIKKIASVKRLQRHFVTNEMPHPTTGQPMEIRRDFLSLGNEGVVKIDDTTATDKEKFRIFGFVFARECELRLKTLCTRFLDLVNENEIELSPDLLLTLDRYILGWHRLESDTKREIRKKPDGTPYLAEFTLDSKSWKPTWSAETGTHVIGSVTMDAFRMLVRWLRLRIREGRTSGITAFDRYFEAKISDPEIGIVLPKAVR